MLLHQPRLELIALVCLSIACWAPATHAEQMQTFGDWEVHYIVLPTTYLQPQIAEKYSLVRGKDRALVNISLVHKENGPSAGQVTGDYKNLLSQHTNMDFVEVKEGAAVYYLAQIKHTDRDLLRFRVVVTIADNQPLELNFSQTMYANP